MKTFIPKLVLMALLFSGALSLVGCKTPEARNESARPWNQPRGWETGIPGLYNEGR